MTIFLRHLKSGARILELGCGGGQDAEMMLREGFDVTPTDGSPGLAREAEKRLGRPVRVMRFEELDVCEDFDGIWANACLLHVPSAQLPNVLAKAHRALRVGGVLYASYKAGLGSDRDRLGRYYNFPSRESLCGIYHRAAPWRELVIEENTGSGYDGVERVWLHCLAMKAS